MGFTSSKLFLLIIFALIMLTLIVQCVGMTVNHWWKTPEIDMMGRAVAHGGIWSACVVLLDFNGLGNCFKYPYISNLEAWFNVLRAAAVVSTVTIGLAAACQVVSIAFESRIAKLLTWILCFVASLFILVEWAIYVGKIENDGYASMNQWEGESNSEALAAILQTGPFYSVCFILTIIADCLCVVCGILGIISWRVNGSELV